MNASEPSPRHPVSEDKQDCSLTISYFSTPYTVFNPTYILSPPMPLTPWKLTTLYASATPNTPWEWNNVVQISCRTCFGHQFALLKAQMHGESTQEEATFWPSRTPVGGWYGSSGTHPVIPGTLPTWQIKLHPHHDWQNAFPILYGRR